MTQKYTLLFASRAYLLQKEMGLDLDLDPEEGQGCSITLISYHPIRFSFMSTCFSCFLAAADGSEEVEKPVDEKNPAKRRLDEKRNTFVLFK
jgi:hypothetical protein